MVRAFFGPVNGLLLLYEFLTLKTVSEGFVIHRYIVVHRRGKP
jgi:hypothetical protein